MTEPIPATSSTSKTRLELVATLLLIAVTLMVGGFAVHDRLRPPPVRQSRGAGVEPVTTSIPIPILGSQVKGNLRAKVALVLFSDFECPVCSRTARDLLPQLDEQYVDTGKVLLVWRHFPLSIHPSARGAAEAAECAGRQGKFWQLHDWAFENQKSLMSSPVRDAAQRMGLDMPAFDNCLVKDAPAAVTSDMALASKLGVAATPTWFIGSVEPDGNVKPVDRIAGLGPVETYRKALDRFVGGR